MCLFFLPLVFDVGNFCKVAWFFEFLVLSLIFVGMLLFELWERNACHLSCWGGGFSVQSTICTDFCCLLSVESSCSWCTRLTIFVLRYPGLSSDYAVEEGVGVVL